MRRLGHRLGVEGAVRRRAARLDVGQANLRTGLVGFRRDLYPVRPRLRSQVAVGVVAAGERPALRVGDRGQQATPNQPWHPEAVTWRFECLVRDAALPPIRLHDLRHCAATFLKAAGADPKDVQELLGHSSITITGDTYTTVIAEPDVERAKAEAAAQLVPRRRRPAA